jgi:hypothetical protein
MGQGLLFVYKITVDRNYYDKSCLAPGFWTANARVQGLSDPVEGSMKIVLAAAA